MEIKELSDKGVLALIGQRVQSERLNRNLTQKQLADRAGIGVRTLRSLEGGNTTTLETLIRVLRGLDKLSSINAFLPEPGISPLRLAELQGQKRQRASGSRKGRR